MERKIKFKIYLQHEDTGRIISLIFDYAKIFSGKASRKINSPDFRRWYIIKKAEYAGLKDRNGREIYEGDVVEYDNATKAKVIFKDGGFCGYDGYASSSDEAYLLLCDGVNPLFDDIKFELEVIGNVYDNPELLK